MNDDDDDDNSNHNTGFHFEHLLSISPRWLTDIVLDTDLNLVHHVGHP